MQKYFTAKQAGEYLGVSPRTLEMWRHPKYAPKIAPNFIKSGRFIRYDIDELNMFIERIKSEQNSS